MPEINFTVSTESVLIPSNTSGTKYAGCYSRKGLHLLATSEELSQGLITENSIVNWYNRVKLLAVQVTGVTYNNPNYFDIINNGPVGGASGGIIQLLNQTTDGVFIMSAIAGSSGETLSFPTQFQKEWWGVRNYLEYGNGVIVGLHNGVGYTGSLGAGYTQATYPVSGATTGNYISAPYDVVFELSGLTLLGVPGGTLSGTDVISVIDTRKTTGHPIIGIINAGITGANISSSSSFHGIESAGVTNTHIVKCIGRKLHLNSTDSTDAPSILYSQLSPDIAGCMLRGNPWESPAGPVRGKILFTLGLEKPLTPAQKTLVVDEEINPVMTVTGLGTILLGNLTAVGENINVTRTLDHIKMLLMPLAYNVLFDRNTETTRSMFKLQTESILSNLVSVGGIESYVVVCDTSNNSQEIIDSNTFNADITVKIFGVINYINISVSND